MHDDHGLAALSRHGAHRVGDVRLRWIDALRGIAALLVLWLHVANAYRMLAPAGSTTYWLNDVVSRLDIGRIGVVVFFLISGFVIPSSIRADSPAPVATFAIRRLFRLFPAYWLSLPVAAWLFFWQPGHPFGADAFLANAFMVQDVFGVPAAEGVYWTLPVEMTFYALTLALFVSGSLDRPQRIAWLAAVLLSVHIGLMFAYWLGHRWGPTSVAFWPLNLSIMLWGTLERLRWQQGRIEHREARWLHRALGGAFLVGMPVVVAGAIDKPLNYAVPYAIGVAVFLIGTRLWRIETRLTDWLGRISYSIYLFHPIVFQAALLWVSRQPAESFWHGQPLPVYLLVNLGLTLLVADLVFRVVERPMMRLGARLARAREHTVARATA